MRRRKIVICLFTILFIAAAVFCAKQEREAEVPFSFQAVTEDGSETIRYWQRDDGEGFVFLPSYVNLDEIQIFANQPIWFDDTRLSYGMNCGLLELNQRYHLSGRSSYPEYITFMQSGNMPTMYIDTVSGSMDIIHEAKGNEERGNMRLYSDSGNLEFRGNLKSIKSRGNASFYTDKKPYSLTLSSDSDLLGMGSAEKWILLANYFDFSNIKNKLVYDFSADVGLPFSPESRWVDLYLNGNYVGLYLLCERNEVHPQRVALTDKEGFLVSKEQIYNLENSGNPYFITEAGAPIRIRFNSLENGAMESIIQSAENAILSENGIDPVTGKHWTELIDLDSWARKYLVEEIFGGIDAGIASQFFFYDSGSQNGKIFAGPVWDFDGAITDTIGLAAEMPIIDIIPEMFFAHRGRETPWFHSLYNKEVFHDYVVDLYQNEFSKMLNIYLNEKIPQYTQLIQKSAQLNSVRWKKRNLQNYIDFIYRFQTERVNFLSDIWINNEDYIEVHVDYSFEGVCQYAIFDYAVQPGNCLPKIPNMAPYKWYITGTNTLFDNSEPIYHEMGIELRLD